MNTAFDMSVRRLPAARTEKTLRRWAWLIIVLFLLFGLAYSLIVPPFETPDEPFHYAFARHIAEGKGLPVQNPESPGPWAQEGSQAPIYYLTAGLLTTGVNQDDFPAMAVRNPRANIGDPLFPGNKNFMLYSGRWQPLQGANLALHIGRWLSLFLGALTLWGTHRLAILVFPAQRALPLLSMAMVAVVPQFIFLSASFSNDNAVIAASTFVLFWLARLLAKPEDARIAWWEWSVLGLGLGIAALSKLQGLGLIPLSGFVVLWMAWRRRLWRFALDALLFAGIPALLVAGWWYARNIMLYGDWSGLAHLMEINGQRQGTMDWGDFWPEFNGLRYSAWGLFGWFNILLPDWFYTTMDLITMVGLSGAIGATVDRYRKQEKTGFAVLVMLWLWLVMMLALLLYWTTQATGSQGRLLFPAISAFAILLVAGIDFWLHWLPALAGRLAWSAILALLLAMSCYALGWLLPGAYYAPAAIAQIPERADPVALRFGADEALRLAAVDIGKERLRAGEALPVTLFLETTSTLDQDYQLFLQLLDENGAEIANLTTHPGWGRNPTTFWTPDALYADRYLLPITGRIENWAPLAARLYVGFIDPATEGSAEAPGTFLPLPTFDADGREVTPIVSTVVVEPPAKPILEDGASKIADSIFGDVIRLKSATTSLARTEPGREQIDVNVLWEAIGTPAADYTAFIHVINSDGDMVGGFDRAPAGERLPTHLWRAGDQILSTLSIAFDDPPPPGAYAVWLGLYDASSGGALRLPVTDAGALLAGDGEVQIGEFVVD